MNNNELKYIIEFILRIAFPNFCNKFTIIGNKAFSDYFNIMFNVSIDENELMSGKSDYILIDTVSKNKYQIPLFINKNSNYFDFESNTSTIIINADIVTLPFFLLSRKEELLNSSRDSLGRYCYEGSLPQKYNIIDIPIADEYSILLRSYVITLFPNFNITPNKFKLILTHDIDTGKRFGGLLNSLKSIIFGDIFIRKSVFLSCRSLIEYFRTKFLLEDDPEIKGIKKLCELSKSKKLISEFYFMGHQNDISNYNYNIKSERFRSLLEYLKKDNMIIGFHGDLVTKEAEPINLQKQNLEEVLLQSTHTGRFHYLKFDVRSSLETLKSLGLKRDLSLGFAYREGFRCGTCHPFYLYDFNENCPSQVIEQPLIVMDGTLKDFRNMSIEIAYQRLLYFQNVCSNVEGSFVLLWHNGCTHRDWKDYFEYVYCRFLNSILE